jgi:alpha-galactosidase/6-phospho-beta-glucosidase family protein
MAPKIAIIGAGSTVFARNLIGDMLRLPALADGTTLALVDIDPDRLATSEVMARRLAEACGAGARVEATGDRRVALDGADYVITCFQVGGLHPATIVDFVVPKRYGIRQTIADTLGIGGIMRGLRTNPGTARRVPRHGGAVPGRAAAPVRQPDGDALLGGGRGEPDPHCRSLPFRPAHRCAARRRARG